MKLSIRTNLLLTLLIFSCLQGGYKAANIDSIKQHAAQGDPYYQGLLGSLLRKGERGQKDLPAAAQWLQLSAAKGDPLGLYNLAVMYESGSFLKEDKKQAQDLYRKAFKGMKKLAENNDIYAQTTLALMYKYGDGTAKNYQKAYKWLKKAAFQGYPEAENYLAEMFQFGLGTTKSRFEAIRWYNKAIKQNYVYAMHDLALMYYGEEKYQKAFTLYSKAAVSGYAPAQNKLAWMYNKALGTNQNVQEMFYWYSKAAEQNHPSAQYNLAMMYYHGVGVAKEQEKAGYWLRRAAANNYQQARNELLKHPELNIE